MLEVLISKYWVTSDGGAKLFNELFVPLVDGPSINDVMRPISKSLNNVVGSRSIRINHFPTGCDDRPNIIVQSTGIAYFLLWTRWPFPIKDVHSYTKIIPNFVERNLSTENLSNDKRLAYNLSADAIPRNIRKQMRTRQ
jgi:hypothetical protein